MKLKAELYYAIAFVFLSGLALISNFCQIVTIFIIWYCKSDMRIQIGEKQELYKGKFTTLWGTMFSIGERARVWEWLQKFDVVYVLPVTHDGKYVFVKQFRIPINAYVLETPAGIIDTKSTPAEVALKEMREETGYSTNEPLEELPMYPISPALTDGFAHGFLARNVECKSVQILEDAEEIEVVKLSKDELLNLSFGNDKQYYVDPRLLGLVALVEARLKQ